MSGPHLNAAVDAITPPPIADVNGWVAGVEFPSDRPLLNMAQAVPSYPPADGLIERVGQVARDAGSAIYAPILGLQPLRERFAAHLSLVYGAEIDAGAVAITAGCNQAFCSALSALAGPGDQVLLPAPWYFNHQMWLTMQGVEVCALPFAEGGGGLPDLDTAAALITDRTRAIALVTPNNPTGAEYPAALLAGFLELAASRNIALVVDETYKDFRSRPGAPHALFNDSRWRERFVSLHSFSKSYAMAGYRVGALVCGRRILSQVEKIQDCIAICAPRISQEAALYALEHLDEWRDGKVHMMEQRVRALEQAFRSNALRYTLVSTGAYFAWVRHPFPDEDSTVVAKRLALRHGVLCVPGATFGPGLERYLRLAFANLEADAMPEVVERLVASQADA